MCHLFAVEYLRKSGGSVKAQDWDEGDGTSGRLLNVSGTWSAQDGVRSWVVSSR